MLVDILLFLFVLGILVFFHEMGHFIAAKACGIYCSRFSLGMPPRVWGIKIGETDYCLGALPIGGFVHMAGQEDAPMTDEERDKEFGNVPPDRWFCNKPVWQRLIVIVAGPLMNLVLAVILYAIVAAMGEYVPESELTCRIGDVVIDSPAASAALYEITDNSSNVDFSKEPDAVGWKTGDFISAINGDKVTNFTDVMMNAALNSGKSVTLEIERETRDGNIKRFISVATPKVFGDVDQARFGISAYETALVKFPLEDTPAEKCGIKSQDIIRRINGEPVDRFTMSKLARNSTEDTVLNMDVERGDQKLSISVQPQTVGRFKDISFYTPLEALSGLVPDEPLLVIKKILKISPNSPFRKDDKIITINGQNATAALVRTLGNKNWMDSVDVGLERKGSQQEINVQYNDMIIALTGLDFLQKPRIYGITHEFYKKSGLKAKDTITEINGQPATALLLRELQNSNLEKTLSVVINRPKTNILKFIPLRPEKTFQTTLNIANTGSIGILWDQKMEFYKVPAIRILPESFKKMKGALGITIQTLSALFGGRLSSNDLGGPVMIFQITTKAAEAGFSWLLRITAFISVNLCVFNLLPLPVLDGGHVVFLGIEGIRRKPLNLKVQEFIQKVGLVFIIGLILFVTYNDILRTIKNI